MKVLDPKEKFANYWNRTQELVGGHNQIDASEIEEIIEMPTSGYVDAKVIGGDGYNCRMPSKHYYVGSIPDLDHMIQNEYIHRFGETCGMIDKLEKQKDAYRKILDNIHNVLKNGNKN